MADPQPPSTGPLAVIAQLKQLWGRQSRGVRLLAILAVLGVLGGAIVTNLLGRTESFTALADGASPDDSQELLSALQARGLNARLRDGKVEVAGGDVESARAVAAAAGLPHGGKGFELFDGSNLGQSSFAEQVNYRRALQGELQRSIAALAQVQGARVHIALGHHSVFKDQAERPTASVALHLHPGQTLSSEQVRGVRQLVAASIEGLAADAVVVVDNHGNLLDAAAASSTDQRAEIEHGVATRVRTMLERVVGPGKVSVVATAAVDERKVSETQELYDNQAPVVRSETRSVDGVDAAQLASMSSGVAGTRGNLPGAAAGATAPGAPQSGRLQETKNYEISRTVRQTTKPDVQLLKLQLAVVVDYASDKDGKPVARTDKELTELTALARQAAGIDDARGDKIEVRSFPFAPDLEALEPAAVAAAPTQLPIMYLGAGGGALLLVLLVVVVMMKKRQGAREPRMMSLALPAPVSELERVLESRLAHQQAMPIESLESRGSLPAGKPTRDRVLDAVRGDIERAAEVLTAWLSEVPPVKGVKS